MARYDDRRYDEDWREEPRSNRARDWEERGHYGRRQQAPWRERPGEDEGRWTEEYGHGSDSEFDYRRSHAREQTQAWADRRDRSQRPDEGYGSSDSDYARRGGNYVTGVGRPGYDEDRQSGTHHSDDRLGRGRRYGPTAARRFNEQGWYGGPDRFSAGADEDDGGPHRDDPDYASWRRQKLGEYDRQYREWRQAQARSHDEEYANWRKERQETFGKEFLSWREKLAAKPTAAGNENSSSAGGTRSDGKTSSSGKSGASSV